MSPAHGPLRVAFAGTPEFARAALDAVAASHHILVGVWTQPDRRAGRGRKLAPSPVKQRALELGVPVHQPERLKSGAAQQAIRDARPDVMVVAAYGLLLPAAALAIPRFGCLNIHASLLPRWRGAAPIQRAILAGDGETGISIMQMDPGLDTGDVLLERPIAIEDDDTAATLHERLAASGAEAIVMVLEGLESGNVRAVPQDASAATYAPKLTKEEAHLDWRRPAAELARAVRAYNPWPVAYALYHGEPLRLWRVVPLSGNTAAEPGRVLAAGREGLDVATGHGILRVLELQPAGGRVQSAAAFANGRDLRDARFS